MSDLTIQNQAAERENDEKTGITTSDNFARFSVVESGLDFIFSHFSEPLFPRKISTSATRREQKPVVDKGHTMSYFEGALWEDCRINAFGLNQTNPDLIFIELDAENFASMRSFKLALTTTLKNIEKKIGGHSTVYWSGRGYHIIQPIGCPIPLEGIKEFETLEPYRASNKFLQFSERYLSVNKCDKGNYPALKSCLLRIPGSLNAKCKAAGVDAEVKVLQEWDGHRPDYRLLLGSFYADLVGQQKGFQSVSTKNLVPIGDMNKIFWIEKLLQTPIEDYRKRARDLIIVPYLVVRRGLTDEIQVSDIVMEWADKCGEFRRLQPSRREFEYRVRTRTYEAVRDRIPSMRLDTLKVKYPDLYKGLKLTGDD